MAVTLDFDKVNSDLYTRATLYETAQVRAFKATFTTALVADTQATEADAIVIGTLRQVANELNAMLFESAANGQDVAFIMDGHHVDADSLALRLEAIVGEPVDVEESTTIGGLLA